MLNLFVVTFIIITVIIIITVNIVIIIIILPIFFLFYCTIFYYQTNFNFTLSFYFLLLTLNYFEEDKSKKKNSNEKMKTNEIELLRPLQPDVVSHHFNTIWDSLKSHPSLFSPQTTTINSFFSTAPSTIFKLPGCWTYCSYSLSSIVFVGFFFGFYLRCFYYSFLLLSFIIFILLDSPLNCFTQPHSSPLLCVVFIVLFFARIYFVIYFLKEWYCWL